VSGYPSKPTFIDELIKKGIFFSQCISSAPYTIASENAMFTSFYPSINKLNGWFKNTPEDLDKNIVTFTDILRAAGYFMACFYPSKIRPYIPPYNFDIFEMMSCNRLADAKLFRMEHYLSVPSPKLLIIDFESIHDDCCANNKGKFTKEKYLKSVDKVAGDVKYFYDKCCNEDDIIIISSDHGVRVIDEPANQRYKDEFVTGSYLTDKTIKTVFSVIAQNKVPQSVEIKNMIRTIDIVPTVLDIASLSPLKAQGISLYPYINKPVQIPKLYAFSETGGMNTSPWKSDTWSVRTPEWKFILTKAKKHLFVKANYQKELYDLINDSYELENKIEEFPEIAEDLFKKIDDMLLNNPKTVKDYYRDNGFDYKQYLKKRFYPFRLKFKIMVRIFLNYKLNYRLRVQLKTILKRFRMMRSLKNWLYSKFPKV